VIVPIIQVITREQPTLCDATPTASVINDFKVVDVYNSLLSRILQTYLGFSVLKILMLDSFQLFEVSDNKTQQTKYKPFKYIPICTLTCIFIAITVIFSFLPAYFLHICNGYFLYAILVTVITCIVMCISCIANTIFCLVKTSKKNRKEFIIKYAVHNQCIDAPWSPNQVRTIVVWIVIIIASFPCLLLAIVNLSLQDKCTNTVMSCTKVDNGTIYFNTTINFNLLPKTALSPESVLSLAISMLPFLKYVWVDLGRLYPNILPFVLEAGLLTAYWCFEAIVYVFFPGGWYSFLGLLCPLAFVVAKVIGVLVLVLRKPRNNKVLAT